MADVYADLDTYLADQVDRPRSSSTALGRPAGVLALYEELRSNGPGICAHVIARAVVHLKEWQRQLELKLTRKIAEKAIGEICDRAQMLIEGIAATWSDEEVDTATLVAASLVRALEHDNADVRALASLCCCFKGMPVEKLTAYLVRLLAKDDDIAVKVATATALEYLGAWSGDLRSAGRKVIDYYMEHMFPEEFTPGQSDYARRVQCCLNTLPQVIASR